MANAERIGRGGAFHGRQVISLSGDGSLAMLLGHLMSAVQEKLPIKVVFNKGCLNFVDVTNRVERNFLE